MISRGWILVRSEMLAPISYYVNVERKKERKEERKK